MSAERIQMPDHETDKYAAGGTTLVKHLIEALQRCDPDALVYTEGCDCIGGALGVAVQSDDSVLITRS